ncbi:MAG: hypothetical protein KKD73_11705 [Proteobacteria bacterium]|nr:hypothetical protein [Pseudomonadota bacterium]MBU1641324.1 hypothetical protein [Pseudomonadota bacterium]
MKMKSRIITFALVLFASSTLFLASPKPARAFLFDPFEIMVESMLTLINTGMNNMMTTMLTLSDDIGTMADRILVMSDNIGLMADRIVETEVLMADLVRDVTDAQGPSALLISPTEGELVSLSSLLDITLSNGASDYVLFMANTAEMAPATNILVSNGDTFAATNRARDYATGSQLYIAIKALNADTMGPISNTVMLNITQ